MIASNPSLAFAFEPEPEPEPKAETAGVNDEETTVAAKESAVPEAPEAAEAPEAVEAEPTADDLVDQGAAAYEAGNLQDAVRLFEESYALDPKPNLLFNIGRVYEELGMLPEAVDFYSQFVLQPRIDLENRKHAVERIRVLRDVLEETAEPKEPEPAPAPSVTPTEDLSPDRFEAPAPPPVDRGRGLRIGGYSLLGVGVGAGAAALGLGINGLISQGKAERECAPMCDDDRVGSIRAQLLAADVLGAVTGALVTASVVLIAVGVKRDGRRERKVSATLAPNHVGFRVRW